MYFKSFRCNSINGQCSNIRTNIKKKIEKQYTHKSKHIDGGHVGHSIKQFEILSKDEKKSYK